MLDLSIVIPTYNEEGNVAELHRQLLAVLNRLGKSYEIIFIDDGSTDRTLAILATLSPVTIIRFRKNFGQTAAIDAGIKNASGNIIVTMDADLQNDPQDIPTLLATIDEGYDVVAGWRWQRKDPASKRFISRGANVLRSIFVNDGIHDSGCTLKAFRKECFDQTDLHGEMHRFIPAILRWQGFTVTEIKVRHHARMSGATKYNWKRILKGLLDMMGVWFWRKFANRPLHLFGGLGVVIGGAGFIIGVVIAVLRLFGVISLTNRIWPLVAVFMVLAGLQLFVSGILADIAVKQYYRNRHTYSVKKIIHR